MATDMKKMKSFIEKHQEREAKKEERKNKGTINFYQNRAGNKGNALFPCPAHDNMDGIPFVERGKHRNCGPENKTDFMCMSNDGTKTDKCPQCKEVSELYAAKKTTKAGKMRRNQRFYWNVIDMSPALDLGADDDLEIPDCFLDYPEEEEKKKYKKRGCKACDWEESCEKGVQAWSIGKKIQYPLMDIIYKLPEGKDDITNPKAGKIVFVKRTGEEAMNTEYSGIQFLDKDVEMDGKELKEQITVKFPKEVIVRIKENIIDLTEVSIPKSKEEIESLMAGVDTEDAIDEEATPTCFGKEYDEDDDDCLKCDYSDPCEVEMKGEDAPGPDDLDDSDPDNSDPDDSEEDDLERKLRERAAQREKQRKAQRTPVTKKQNDTEVI